MMQVIPHKEILIIDGNMSNRNNGYNNRMNNSNFNEINLNNLSVHETIQLNKSNNPKRK